MEMTLPNFLGEVAPGAIDGDARSKSPARCTMTAAIYFGELAFALVLAIGSLVASTLKPFIAIVLVCAASSHVPWSNTSPHRYVLHAVASVQHRRHHARPREAVDKIFWQIWLAFAVVYLTTGGSSWPAFLWPMPGIYPSTIAPIIIPRFFRHA